MKKTFIFLGAFACIVNVSVAQGTWTQLSDFPGVATHEYGSFSVNGKGYVVGGTIAYPTWTSEVWEYDPAGAGTWTQKAPVPLTGGMREPACFAIGSKGYAGTGVTSGSTLTKQFYEYDPVGNAWTAKANFGGTARRDASGFSIGTKGYIATGADASGSTKDLWEYDPGTDKWTAKTSLGGVIRNASIAFALGSKGYLATGRNGATTYNDLWEYNPAGDTWTQVAAFPGVTRSESVVFTIGLKAYVGIGHTGGAAGPTDFYAYDQSGNAWSSVTSMPQPKTGERNESTAFSIGTKGYVCGGNIAGSGGQKDFWEYAETVTGISSQGEAASGMSIYPNPFHISTVLSFSSAVKNAEVIVTDLKGSVVRKIRFSGDRLSLEKGSLQTGIYFIQVMEDGKSLYKERKKIIVQ